MKKRFLLLLVLLFCGIGVWLFLEIPTYPNPYMLVDSYEELQEKLQKAPDIVLLSPEQLGFVETYELHHDRSRFARPIGYSLYGQIQQGKVTIYMDCSIHEITEDTDPVSVTAYRGITIKTFEQKRDDVSIQTVQFCLNNYYYRMGAFFDLPDDEQPERIEQLRSILSEYAAEIITLSSPQRSLCSTKRSFVLGNWRKKRQFQRMTLQCRKQNDVQNTSFLRALPAYLRFRGGVSETII